MTSIEYQTSSTSPTEKINSANSETERISSRLNHTLQMINAIRAGRVEKYVREHPGQLSLPDVASAAGMTFAQNISPAIRSLAQENGCDTSLRRVVMDEEIFKRVAFEFIRQRFVDLNNVIEWLKANPKPYYSGSNVVAASRREKMNGYLLHDIREISAKYGADNSSFRLSVDAQQLLSICSELPRYNPVRGVTMQLNRSKQSKREKPEIVENGENEEIEISNQNLFNIAVVLRGPALQLAAVRTKFEVAPSKESIDTINESIRIRLEREGTGKLQALFKETFSATEDLIVDIANNPDKYRSRGMNTTWEASQWFTKLGNRAPQFISEVKQLFKL